MHLVPILDSELRCKQHTVFDVFLPQMGPDMIKRLPQPLGLNRVIREDHKPGILITQVTRGPGLPQHQVTITEVQQFKYEGVGRGPWRTPSW